MVKLSKTKLSAYLLAVSKFTKFMKFKFGSQFILKNKYVTLKPFEKKNISKIFINFLNNKSVNKYLETRKKKQTKKSALKYLHEMQKKNFYYWAIIDNNKKKIIGTITLKRINKNAAYLGYMIGLKKYYGSKHSDNAFLMVLDFSFKILNLKIINGGTEKGNIGAIFNVIRNGFKLTQKKRNTFLFALNKKNFKRKIKYEISRFNSIP